MLIKEFCHKILFPHIDEEANISLLDRNGRYIHCYVRDRKELMSYWEKEVLDYKIYIDKDSDELWVNIIINDVKR